MGRTSKILGLEKYGLDSEALRKLGDRRVHFSIQLRGPALEPLFPIDPASRNSALSRHLQESQAALDRRYSYLRLRPRSLIRPWTIDAVAEAATVVAVSRSRLVVQVWIERVAGIRRKASPARKSLFAVRGRVAIQVEGQRTGMQTVEDRIVVVEARSFADAERRLASEWREYERPYLNPKGEMVRWHLEEIIDVYDLCDQELDRRGTEVWSSMHRRRLRPELEWHPRARTPEGILELAEASLAGIPPVDLRSLTRKLGE